MGGEWKFIINEKCVQSLDLDKYQKKLKEEYQAEFKDNPDEGRKDIKIVASQTHHRLIYLIRGIYSGIPRLFLKLNFFELDINDDERGLYIPNRGFQFSYYNHQYYDEREELGLGDDFAACDKECGYCGNCLY